MSDLQLSLHEARVVAALTEKSLTTPDYYPMTVNGLMAACNQKNSRSPVLSLSEGEVGHALTTLEEKGLVSRDTSSMRATKWRSRFQHQLLLKATTQAVLVSLILRGAQTSAELRANAAALNGPADVEGVQAALDDLADRAAPLVCTLPRLAGQAAVRHAHLLSGEPVLTDFIAAPQRSGGGGDSERVTQLEARIATLEARLAALESQLGLG